MLAGLTGGCGFQPLYGGGDGGLPPIAVDRIPDRDGQVLRSLLEERLTPRGLPAAPAYTLTVEPRVRQTDLTVRQDATTARFNLQVNAWVSLTPTGETRPVWRESLRVNTSYSDLADAFANRASEQAALERAYRQLAETIRLRLGLYFARPAEPS